MAKMINPNPTIQSVEISNWRNDTINEVGLDEPAKENKIINWFNDWNSVNFLRDRIAAFLTEPKKKTKQSQPWGLIANISYHNQYLFTPLHI